MSLLVIGSFDSEMFWASKNNVALPMLQDNSSKNIVLAMDELLFLSCNADDFLITRFAIDTHQLNYLKKIGLNINCNAVDISTDNMLILDNKIDNFELLLSNNQQPYFKDIIGKNRTIDPFAYLPTTEKFCMEYDVINQSPPIDIIKRVNSKFYSSYLYSTMSNNYHYAILKSSDELYSTGIHMLKDSTIMIKDDFGVSGKGNIHIQSEQSLKNIVNYVKKQEDAGKQTLFLLEKYLLKSIDFSTQLILHKNGEYDLLSIQILQNHLFSYQGSVRANSEFTNKLKSLGYFDIISKVMAELSKERYFGHICIDSMILEDQSLHAIVEINARKSMSLLKHHLDNFLNKYGIEAYFTYLSLSVPFDHIEYDNMLEKMESLGLLFTLKTLKGVIPLSPNALFINAKLNQKTYNKGRLYLGVVQDKDDRIMNRFKEFLVDNRFKIQ